MLCLADRGLTAHPLFLAAAASGAALLWRAKSNAVLPVLGRLPDGSYLSELVASPDKHRRADVLPGRVVDYGISKDGRAAAKGTTYRLITNILDPADELAALYAERWELESLFDELKTHQRGPRLILRSRPRRHLPRNLGLRLRALRPTGVDPRRRPGQPRPRQEQLHQSAPPDAASGPA